MPTGSASRNPKSVALVALASFSFGVVLFMTTWYASYSFGPAVSFVVLLLCILVAGMLRLRPLVVATSLVGPTLAFLVVGWWIEFAIAVAILALPVYLLLSRHLAKREPQPGKCYKCRARISMPSGDVFAGGDLGAVIGGSPYPCESCGTSFCADCMRDLRKGNCPYCGCAIGW